MNRLLTLALSACLLVPGAASLALVPGGPATAAASDFTPRPGPTFNNPVGSFDDQRAILRKINRSIEAVPRGGKIQIFTWNFLTKTGADNLLRAQKRGVTVRLIMDRNNTIRIDNPQFRRLASGLRRGNASRPPVAERSWARLCTGTCRSSGGAAAHSKFFMFSQVGRAKNVVIQGSANFTEASATNQWNDVMTHTRDAAFYAFYDRVFQEASRDEKARRIYLRRSFDGFDAIAFPLAGRPDPVMQLLDQVRCRNAGNTASGRTVLRITPDVLRQERGMRLATKVRNLWEAGCDVRIAYTIVGIDVGRMLREDGPRGPVPMRQLVQDFDGDGDFDNYFHLKAMSIVGNVAGDRTAHVLLNGSSNWTNIGAASDENLGIYYDRAYTLTYQRWIDRWYEGFPSAGSPRSSARANLSSPVPSPWSVTTPTTAPSEDGLVFGSGARAVWSDGRPYSLTGVDPFAEREDD